MNRRIDRASPRRHAHTLAPFLVFLLTSSAPAVAQQLSIAPQIGFYFPTELLSQAATGASFTELEGGPSFGGRLGLWFGSRFGIQATAAYVPTTFRLTQGSQNITKEDAKRTQTQETISQRGIQIKLGLGMPIGGR